MNTHIIRSSFIDVLVGNIFFQQWYLLSVDVDERMKWFDELIGINGYDFDTICRGILITLFGLMEEAITSDNDKCFENLFRDYLIKREIFKELVDIVLPAKLKNNRMCTTCREI